MDSNFNFYVQLELNFVNKFSVTWNLFVIIDIPCRQGTDCFCGRLF